MGEVEHIRHQEMCCDERERPHVHVTRKGDLFCFRLGRLEWRGDEQTVLAEVDGCYSGKDTRMSDEADLAGALRRHTDDHCDQWDAYTFSSSSGPVWVLISRQEIEGVSHWTPLPEPDALDQLRARVDADPAGREHVERLKQEAREQMGGELTDDQLAERRRLVGQLRHHTTWAASVEWWSDRPLPAEVATDLV